MSGSNDKRGLSATWIGASAIVLAIGVVAALTKDAWWWFGLFLGAALFAAWKAVRAFRKRNL